MTQIRAGFQDAHSFGWSDGATFLPLFFSFLSSGRENDRSGWPSYRQTCCCWRKRPSGSRGSVGTSRFSSKRRSPCFVLPRSFRDAPMAFSLSIRASFLPVTSCRNRHCKCCRNKDERSCGALFPQCCQEIKDMDLVAALALIMLAIHEAARLALAESGEKGEKLFRVSKSLLPLRLQEIYSIYTCES